MKKVLFFSIGLCALAFMSCKKCQTCDVNTQQNVNGYNQNVTVSEEYCGDQYDDAPAEGTYTQNSGGTEQTVTITCEDN